MNTPAEFTQTIAGLTIITTAYTSGDQLGNVMTFPGVAGILGGMVDVKGAIVTDDSGVLGAFDLVIYAGTAAPAFAVDNAPSAISAADAQKAKALLPFVAANIANIGGRVVADYMVPAGTHPVRCADTSKDLYVGLIARSANAVFAGGATSIKVTLLIDRP